MQRFKFLPKRSEYVGFTAGSNAGRCASHTKLVYSSKELRSSNNAASNFDQRIGIRELREGAREKAAFALGAASVFLEEEAKLVLSLLAGIFVPFLDPACILADEDSLKLVAVVGDTKGVAAPVSTERVGRGSTTT